MPETAITYIQKYLLKPALQEISRHDQLPIDCRELGRRLDPRSPGFEDLYVFVKRENHLSILVSYTRTNRKTNVTGYYCKQYDFPLKALSWLPRALDDFRRPPTEGGLHAGAMISKDADVDGEILTVGSTNDGYQLSNWSRQSHPVTPDSTYVPTYLSFSYEFLYNLGFLDLWKQLGEKYENGLL